MNKTGEENLRKGALDFYFPKFISTGVDILWHLSLYVPAAIC